MKNRFEVRSEVLKVESKLGLVFGWAMICKEDGQDYFDTQGDHIPEEEMLKAATDFMVSSRAVGEMHEREDQGTAVFAFPLTEEIAKTYGIQCNKTGLLWAIRPSPAVLAKFESGEYTGFSIGGERGDDEVVEE